MKENTPNETPIITLEVIAQRKAEKLEEVQQVGKEINHRLNNQPFAE